MRERGELNGAARTRRLGGAALLGVLDEMSVTFISLRLTRLVSGRISMSAQL